MTVSSDFCRTLVDEWHRSGIEYAVVSPGSRSTPLAVALAEMLTTHVILDERCASYTALGLALASGRPAIVVCTSGTAAMHFHGAVAEADQAGVPLLVCTADRPPELQDVGAPQTTDQTHLYGRAVRWFAEPGPPDETTATTWRSLAARAVCEATGAHPGPVHLNLAFREPFLDDGESTIPAGRRDGGPWHRGGTRLHPGSPSPDLAAACAGATRPLVVAGHDAPPGLVLADVPVLSDHRGPITGTVAHWDLLLRSREFTSAHRPDLIVRCGMAPASKVLDRHLAALDAPQVVLAPAGRWVDPSRTATWVVRSPVELSLHGEAGWHNGWRAAATAASGAIDAVLDATPTASEPGVARRLFATRPAASTVVVSSSMPIRDLEAFATPRPDVRVLANRGVNGIDGVTSTAIGVASTGAPTTLLIGDLALLHDQGALTGLAGQTVDLTIVVVDNDGGGIFSFLPQHDVLDPPRFEQLFGTPPAIDAATLLVAHGIDTTVATTTSELDTALDVAGHKRGVRAVVVRTERTANRRIHDTLAGAVAVALGP